MTLQFHVRGINEDDEMRRQVESDLTGLSRALDVTSAHVAMQCQRGVTPPHQAVATLRVPGPDLHAAARDHTWPAAWQKVVARLRQQAEERRGQQAARHEHPPRHPRPASRRPK